VELGENERALAIGTSKQHLFEALSREVIRRTALPRGGFEFIESPTSRRPRASRQPISKASTKIDRSGLRGWIAGLFLVQS